VQGLVARFVLADQAAAAVPVVPVEALLARLVTPVMYKLLPPDIDVVHQAPAGHAAVPAATLRHT
jgi:hypothetical protein